MRTGFAYTSARILLFVAAMGLLYLAGARGLLLVALALVVSALASYVLLSRQRDAMSAALSGRLVKTRRKAAELKARLDEGAAAEDTDDPGEAEAAAASTPAATGEAATPSPASRP
ncbi:MAG TPA: DUF4229 domain-containing protein [Trebonia sp.]|nr:DUF4229 domain-containing protein [Trebonia sp.]